MGTVNLSMRIWVLAAVGLLVVATVACSPAPPAVPTPAPTKAPEPTPTAVPVGGPDYGVSAFIWGHPATTERDLQLVTDGGFRWQKSLFQWRDIEGAAKGQFDWIESDRIVRASAAARIKIVARLDFEPYWSRKDHAHNGPPDDYQDYWDFVSAFVTRYGSTSTIGRVHAIQVWNEPNIDREWGNQAISPDSAADYVRLLRGAYRAAHAADPNIVVVSAGLSPTGVTDAHSADDLEYLKWMYRGGLSGAFDALGVNANAQAPVVAAAFGSLKDFPHPSFYFRRVEQLRQVMVDNGDTAKKIWLLEWGWTADTVHPAYKWFAVTEKAKGDNVVEALKYARANWNPWIGVMVLWTLADPSWDKDREEYWWAITNPDGSPRDAYKQVRAARATGVLP
jgi:hypothetical protein